LAVLRADFRAVIETKAQEIETRVSECFFFGNSVSSALIFSTSVFDASLFGTFIPREKANIPREKFNDPEPLRLKGPRTLRRV
jgi:hypothetical protein